MNLPFFIARRYLFAKKSHNVINIISAISAIGMAIGTAALIIILSIYNGFDELVKSTIGYVEPDVLVAPARGKVFLPAGSGFEWLRSRPEVQSVCPILQEQVFVDYDGRQSIAKAKGVDAAYERETPLKDNLRDGTFSLYKGDLPQIVVGAGLAYKMGMNPAFLSPRRSSFGPNRSFPWPTRQLRSNGARPSRRHLLGEPGNRQRTPDPSDRRNAKTRHEAEVSGLEIQGRRPA